MMKLASQNHIAAVLPSSSKRPPTTSERSGAAFGLILLRDAIPLPWFLALGGAASLLIDRIPYLPSHTSTILTLSLFAYFPLRALLTHIGLLSNPRTARVVPGMTRAMIPGDLDDGQGAPSFAMVNLMVRSNSALGIFDPAFNDIAQAFTKMRKDLLEDPEKHGLLNLEGWMGTTRENGNTLRTVFYFKDEEAVWRFAHDKLHKSEWMKYHKQPHRYREIEISHEMFVVRAAGFEGIYGNAEPNGAGELYEKRPVAGSEDEEWMPTLKPVGGCPGVKDRTSRQRMGVAGESEKSVAY